MGINPLQGFRVAAVPVGEKAGGGARSQSRNRLFLPQKGAGEDEVSALSKRSRGFSPALEPGEGGLGPAGSRPHRAHKTPSSTPKFSLFLPKTGSFFQPRRERGTAGRNFPGRPEEVAKILIRIRKSQRFPFFPPSFVPFLSVLLQKWGKIKQFPPNLGKKVIFSPVFSLLQALYAEPEVGVQ